MDLDNIRLAVVFKDFAAWLRVSCVGLNVAGYNTAKVLAEHGITTTVFPVRHNIDIFNSIVKYNKEHDLPLTHVVISAPWLLTWDLKTLIEHFKDIRFVVICHSNVGFLMSDARGVELLRQGVELAETHHNLSIGGNCEIFVEWMRLAYGKDFVLLPNLYPLDGHIDKPRWRKREGRIKIGSFGAVRPYKNHITAAAASILISKHFDLPVEFHMSKGGEGGIASAIDQICADVPGFSLVKYPWQYWDDFVKVVGDMDLLMQMSYTESFNLVTADGVFAGVPSVVSEAIRWAPRSWMADADNVLSVAARGIHLLQHGMASDGVHAIREHNKESVRHWLKFLTHKHHHHFQ